MYNSCIISEQRISPTGVYVLGCTPLASHFSCRVCLLVLADETNNDACNGSK